MPGSNGVPFLSYSRKDELRILFKVGTSLRKKKVFIWMLWVVVAHGIFTCSIQDLFFFLVAAM